MTVSTIAVKRMHREHKCAAWPENPDHEKTYCQTDEGLWVAVVRRFINDLKYGNVTLTVHDGRVVQVEKTEKVRF